MTLEQQATNLELSGRLRDLGIKHKAAFFWTDWFKEGKYSLGIDSSPIKIRTTQSNGSYVERTANVIPAFTVAELGELLGKEANQIMFGEGEWGSAAPNLFESTRSKTEADARGKLLVNLIENKTLIPYESY